MTGRPDDVPALARVLMPGIQQHGYRAYPLGDHIADKLAAIFERHGTLRAPSTRYKDLVDLVAILTRVSVQADPQQQALESEAERCGLTLPGQFDVPPPAAVGDGLPRGSAAFTPHHRPHPG